MDSGARAVSFSHVVLFTDDVERDSALYAGVTRARWRREGQSRRHDCVFIHGRTRAHEAPGFWLYFGAPAAERVLDELRDVAILARDRVDDVTFVFARHPELGRFILADQHGGSVRVTLHAARTELAAHALAALTGQALTAYDGEHVTDCGLGSVLHDEQRIEPMFAPYFLVDDVERAAERSLERGCRILGVRELWGVTFHAVDPQGNLFGCYEIAEELPDDAGSLRAAKRFMGQRGKRLDTLRARFVAR